MSTESTVVIVGAGHAGGAACAQLREQGHRGPIVLLGDEPGLPYHRPPLSKAFLKGEADQDSLLLRPASWYEEQDITVRSGRKVYAIERDARQVVLAEGSRVPYDYLILATGASARRLAVRGAQLDNILSLRDAGDAARLKAALQPGRRLAIVGGGYIGLEVAASARALGLDVTVLEREERLLARVASAPLAAFFAQRHASHGVTILRGARLSHFEGEGAVEAVVVEDGSRIACDVALVGVGAQPRDELARACGLECGNGVVVDEHARTSDPRIFAIGDVSWRPMGVYGSHQCRLESVPNANEQARQAACAIAGNTCPACEVPWFWSEQYDIRLQIAGLPCGADRQVVRGMPELGKFAVYHLNGEQVMAVEAVNSPLDFIAGKQFIASGVAVCRTKLGDTACKAKEAALAPA
ncbi:NAD(P)/FAD-dependent oxidoreductase [Massilia niastensis]|uniref:NAD(P)/FAD-dependent oxidoreductase n=1 Tax=Massilia niastensis TaxID=544911 RepID=UPI00035C6122|nr:FAD-dependent oxidoreductase [Massilia niastensis]